MSFSKNSTTTRMSDNFKSSPKSPYSMSSFDNGWPKKTDPVSPLKDISQAKLIDNYFGQLAVKGRPSKGKYNFLFHRGSQSYDRKVNVNQPLPALTNPGSNMNNNLNLNTHSAMGHMNLEPLANAEELISLNPMNLAHDENYHKARVFFVLSSFVSLILIIFEISAVALGAVYTNCCQMVDVFLVVSGCFHVIIILLEWAKAWVWGSNNNPVVPDSNSDHMQICISCVLAVLYGISTVWYIVGFAWIPTVFANFLQQNQTYIDDIIIVKFDKQYIQHIPRCHKNFYVYAISYQVIVGLLSLLRLVSCCMSDFCKGLCNKFAKHTEMTGFELYSESPLNQILPPIRDPLFQYGFRSDINFTGLICLYNTDNLSMITPLPIYPGDKLSAPLVLEAPFQK